MVDTYAAPFSLYVLPVLCVGSSDNFRVKLSREPRTIYNLYDTMDDSLAMEVANGEVSSDYDESLFDDESLFSDGPPSVGGGDDLGEELPIDEGAGAMAPDDASVDAMDVEEEALLPTYGAVVIPHLLMDIHAEICSFLCDDDLRRFVTSTSRSLRAAPSMVPPKIWPKLHPSKHWFSTIFQEPNNDRLPLAEMHDLRIGLTDCLDQQYLQSLYSSVYDVTITLSRHIFHAVQRFQESLHVFGPMMGVNGVVIFAGDKSPPEHGEWEEDCLTLLEGGGDSNWDSRLGITDYPAAIMFHVKSFEEAWREKGVRVYFEGLRPCTRNEDSSSDAGGFPRFRRCHRCSSLVHNISLDTLASIIVFQAMAHIRYQVAGVRFHNGTCPFQEGFSFLCADAYAYSPQPDAGKYHCHPALHSLLEVYKNRTSSETVSTGFCDLSYASLDFYATFYGLVEITIEDTSRVKVGDHYPARAEAYSQVVEIHESLTEDDLETYLKYVCDLIRSGHISCESLINLVNGDLLPHLTLPCPTDFKSEMYEWGRAAFEEPKDYCFLDGIFSRKVVYGFRLRRLMREIGSLCRDEQVFDFLPETVSMEFFPDPSIYDIIGFGELIWDQYEYNDSYCSITDDLVYAVILMYAEIRRNRQSPLDQICTLSELHTVHIITRHLRMLLHIAKDSSGYELNITYLNTLDCALELIKDTWNGSRQNGYGFIVVPPGNVLADPFYSRSMERSPHTKRHVKDVYGNDQLVQGGYEWRDLLTVIFGHLEEARRCFVRWECDDARKLFNVCKAFLLQERACCPDSVFPVVGPWWVWPEPKKQPYLRMDASEVAYPQFNITQHQLWLLQNVGPIERGD